MMLFDRWERAMGGGGKLDENRGKGKCSGDGERSKKCVFREGSMNETTIIYFGQEAKVACDRHCNKAWGMNDRPKIQLSDDEDDWAYLADSELGEAPVDPGTTEGWHRKPLSPDEFPNKWCARACERCVMSNPGKWDIPLVLRDFSKRVYNLLRRCKMEKFNQIANDVENEHTRNGTEVNHDGEIVYVDDAWACGVEDEEQ